MKSFTKEMADISKLGDCSNNTEEGVKGFGV